MKSTVAFKTIAVSNTPSKSRKFKTLGVRNLVTIGEFFFCNQMFIAVSCIYYVLLILLYFADSSTEESVEVKTDTK